VHAPSTGSLIVAVRAVIAPVLSALPVAARQRPTSSARTVAFSVVV
jgi:hypothetical protein